MGNEEKDLPAPVRLADEAIEVLRREGAEPDQKLIAQLRGYAMQQEKTGALPDLAGLVAAARQGPAFFKAARAPVNRTARENHRTYESVVAQLNAGFSAFAGQENIEQKLLTACRDGNLEEAREILTRLQLTTRDTEPLRHAVHEGHADIVGLLLQQEKVDKNAWKNMALQIAASAGQLGIVRYAVEQCGADPAINDNYALISAVEHRHVEIVRYLLEQEHIDAGAKQNTILRLAAENGCSEIVRLLLKQGGVNTAAYDNLVLCFASDKGHHGIVRLLLEQDRVDAAAQKQAALCHAAKRGHLEIARLLLDHGADAAANDSAALRVAVEGGHLDIVRLLLRQGGMGGARDKALCSAAFNGKTEIVRLLLKQDGVNAAAYDNLALRFAAEKGHHEIVRLLLEQDRVDAAAKNNLPLRLSIGNSHIETVALLLEHGVRAGEDAEEMLCKAAYRNCPEIVRLLVEKGGINNSAQKNAALFVAAEFGHAETVRYLLDHGADMAAGDHRALHVAASRGKEKVVRILFERGADIKAWDEQLLRGALSHNHMALAQLLYERQAELYHSLADSMNIDASTPPSQKDLYDYIVSQRQWAALTGACAPLSLHSFDPALFRKDAYNAVCAMLEKEGYDTSSTNGPPVLRTRVMAYQASTLFETEARVLTYLERWGGAGHQPLHNLIHFLHMPKKADFNLKDWQSAIMACGPVMAKLLAFADKLPSPLRNDEGTAWSPVKTRAEIARIKFNRAAEHPELAALCFNYQVPEASFERALDIVQATPPHNKNIPEITLEGENFDIEGGKFYRLPANDVRGLFLGELTDCCQSVGGAGSDCAIHGYTSENGGFYVVENARGQIIAQTWAWRGERGEMCWDTLEMLGQNVRPAQWEKLLRAVADDLSRRQDHDVTALTVGTGGDTPGLVLGKVFEQAQKPAKPRHYGGYRESQRQLLVWRPET